MRGKKDSVLGFSGGKDCHERVGIENKSTHYQNFLTSCFPNIANEILSEISHAALKPEIENPIISLEQYRISAGYIYSLEQQNKIQLPTFDDLHLSIRAQNVLARRLSVFSVEQLICLTENDLLNVNGCGKNTLFEIKKSLATFNLYLNYKFPNNFSNNERNSLFDLNIYKVRLLLLGIYFSGKSKANKQDVQLLIAHIKRNQEKQFANINSSNDFLLNLFLLLNMPVIVAIFSENILAKFDSNIIFLFLTTGLLWLDSFQIHYLAQIANIDSALFEHIIQQINETVINWVSQNFNSCFSYLHHQLMNHAGEIVIPHLFEISFQQIFVINEMLNALKQEFYIDYQTRVISALDKDKLDFPYLKMANSLQVMVKNKQFISEYEIDTVVLNYMDDIKSQNSHERESIKNNLINKFLWLSDKNHYTFIKAKRLFLDPVAVIFGIAQDLLLKISSQDERKKMIFFKRMISPSPLTLEQLSLCFGCTKERIRQVQNRLNEKMIKNFIKTRINKERSILFKDTAILKFDKILNSQYTEDEINTVNYLIARCNVFIDWSFGVVCNISESDISIKCNNIIDYLDKNNHHYPFYITPKQIKVAVVHSLSDSKFQTLDIGEQNKRIEFMTQLFVRDYLILKEEGVYSVKFPKGKTMCDLIVPAFKLLYPDGAFLFKNKLEIARQMSKLLPEFKMPCPQYISQIGVDYPQLVLLWGSGFYIHKDNVQINQDVIRKAIERCYWHFDSGIGTEFKVNLLFKENETAFIAAGVPTPQALYSLMRLEKDPRCSLDEYPRIRDAQIKVEKITLTEILKNFFLAREFVQKQEVTQYFCVERGWKDYELSQTLKLASVIKWKPDLFIHVSKLSVNQDKINELSSIIFRELKQLNAPVDLQKFEQEYPVLWREVCQPRPSVYAMSQLIPAVLKDRPFFITRSGCMVTLKH